MNDMTQPPERGPSEQQPPRTEPVFNLPPVVLALIGACVAIYLVGAYVLSPQRYLWLLEQGALIPTRVDVDPTAVVTFLTYAFFHGSLAHLLVNMVWLAAFGSPLANRLGPVRFLAFWAVTSACGALLYWMMNMSTLAVMVGASGAISGMMGAAARFGFRIDRSHGKAAFWGEPLPILVCLRLRSVVAFLSIWLVINLLTGLIPLSPGAGDQIAWEAHIGGFLAGFLGIDWFGQGSLEPSALPVPRDEAAARREQRPGAGDGAA